MAGILTVVCTFLGKAALVATVMGILTRCFNIWIRAVTGKEEIL